MLQRPEYHGRKSRYKCEGVTQTATDQELLARRDAIIAEEHRVQVRCQHELRPLSAEYKAVMRALHWPLGCVVRPKGKRGVLA